MSPSIRIADNRRTTARVVLFMVVAVMTTLVLFSGGPIGAISFAQQQTTPAPTIQFMNPDNDTSNEVTAINDGTDDAYHLVAWVSTLPANGRVEFKYQASGQQEVTVGTGTQTAIGDTFEFFWQRTNMPADGTYTLRAVLFSGTTQIAQDEQSIRINNTQPPPPPNADTDVPNAVEIRNPTNGGRVGFFTNAGVTAAQIDVTASAGTETVTVYYTTSAPGTDPTWQECGSEDNPDDTDDGVSCALGDNETPEAVRGIAAVAGDSDPLGLPDVDSADAHRANGYTQDPFSLTLTPATQRVDLVGTETNFPCSAFILAKVFDQFGQRVVGVNVDVHAAGPLDRLGFDDPGTTEQDSSPHKAPDQGGHRNEPEADCEGNPTAFNSASQQGEHEVGGEGDIKHIESAAAGTNQEGTFRFRMASGGSGITQITAWADEDANDVFCAEEPNADASISWGQAAETSPTGLNPEQTTCPRPTGPATGTQSPSTASPSPTATSTTSPTPTNTQTQSPSPTPTPEPDPVVEPTNTTINYNGRAFTGKTKSDLAKCRRGRTVVLKKVRDGRDKTVGTDRTNRRGNYSITQRNANGKYYSVAKKKTFINGQGAQVTCRKDRSPTKRV